MQRKSPLRLTPDSELRTQIRGLTRQIQKCHKTNSGNAGELEEMRTTLEAELNAPWRRGARQRAKEAGRHPTLFA